MAVEQLFGTLPDGKRVMQYLLRNRNGMEVSCISYGCRLTHLLLPVRTGSAPARGADAKAEDAPTRLVDILLGYHNLSGYLGDKLYHGALLGRYAGRIAGASFKLGARRYRIRKNEGGNFLHGGLANTLFEGEVVSDNVVRFTRVSPEGEDGFPGQLWLGITYTLTEENELILDYRAETTAATYLNLSNHSYFNLAGNQSGSAMNQLLTVNAGGYLELDAELIPTGRALPVAGGAFDFRQEKIVGRDIVSRDEQLYLAKGYDHCFILQKNRAGALTHAATLRDPASRRSLEVYTTQPGMLLYTANRITGSEPAGKGGQSYMRRSGICFETMHFPDSPNHPDFPTTLLEPGEAWHETTVFKASWPVPNE